MEHLPQGRPQGSSLQGLRQPKFRRDDACPIHRRLVELDLDFVEVLQVSNEVGERYSRKVHFRGQVQSGHDFLLGRTGAKQRERLVAVLALGRRFPHLAEPPQQRGDLRVGVLCLHDYEDRALVRQLLLDGSRPADFLPRRGHDLRPNQVLKHLHVRLDLAIGIASPLDKIADGVSHRRQMVFRRHGRCNNQCSVIDDIGQANTRQRQPQGRPQSHAPEVSGNAAPRRRCRRRPKTPSHQTGCRSYGGISAN